MHPKSESWRHPMQLNSEAMCHDQEAPFTMLVVWNLRLSDFQNGCRSLLAVISSFERFDISNG